ncbi:MAG: acyl carrier protein [Betaproteobacteria bacterium]|nr:acyl carrier protein [Betaproteobacteria bacterium]
MDKQLQDEICAAIAERFGVDTEKLVPEATMESLNIDSLSMIEFMFEMEDKLGINLSDSREPLKTLADIYAEIDKAMQTKQGASGS